VAFPLPHQAATSTTAAPPAASAATNPAVERVDVQVERDGVITRKQVSTDGKTVEEVPVGPGEATSASSLDEQRRNETRRAASAPRRRQQFFVQVGAFSVESNATALRDRLRTIGHSATIDVDDNLYRVRLGPFATREAAIEARATLEARGMSAMIVAE
jgi:cell division septation protein DedD